MKSILKQLFRIDQLAIALSLSYLGLIFGSRAENEIWLFVTAAAISAKLVQKSFQKIMDNPKRNKSNRYKELLILPTKKKKLILWFTTIIFSAIFIASAFLINELCYFFSIGSVALMIIFPFIKRYSSLPYYYLGFFEAACPVGGFLAANNRIETLPFIITAGIFFWSAGLETAWGTFEIESDIEKKIFSIPAKLGLNKAMIFSIIFYAASSAAFITLGIIEKTGTAYWIAILCFLIIIIRQEILLKNKDKETALIEFLQINKFAIPAIFIGTIIDFFYG